MIQGSTFPPRIFRPSPGRCLVSFSLRLLVLLSPLAVSHCDRHAGHDTHARVGKEVELQCGTLVPNLSLGCFDGVPINEIESVADNSLMPVPTAPEHLNRALEWPCAIAVGDQPTQDITLSLDAICHAELIQSELPRWESTMTLSGTMALACAGGFYGSSANARPLWTLSVNLFDQGTYRLDLDTTSDHESLCSIRLANDGGDHIQTDSSHIMTRFFSGPVAVPLEIDCTSRADDASFLGQSCFGEGEDVVPSISTMSRELTLTLVVGRCPEGC